MANVTFDVDKELLAEAMALGEHSSECEAVDTALAEYILHTIYKEGKKRQIRHEYALIWLFVQYLRQIRGWMSGLRITSLPERSNPGDIDAIAESSSLKVAIEHTLVITYDKQKLDTDHFAKVMVDVERKLKGVFPYNVQLSVEPMTVQYSAGLVDTVVRLLRVIIPSLPYGWTKLSLGDIPFKIDVSKYADLCPEVFVTRTAPNRSEYRLEDRIKEQLVSKKKLVDKYPDYHTILLLESDDLALMSKSLVISSVNKAVELYGNKLPNEIWFADTGWIANGGSCSFSLLWPNEYGHK